MLGDEPTSQTQAGRRPRSTSRRLPKRRSCAVGGRQRHVSLFSAQAHRAEPINVPSSGFPFPCDAAARPPHRFAVHNRATTADETGRFDWEEAIVRRWVNPSGGPRSRRRQRSGATDAGRSTKGVVQHRRTAARMWAMEDAGGDAGQPGDLLLPRLRAGGRGRRSKPSLGFGRAVGRRARPCRQAGSRPRIE